MRLWIALRHSQPSDTDERPRAGGLGIDNRSRITIILRRVDGGRHHPRRNLLKRRDSGLGLLCPREGIIVLGEVGVYALLVEVSVLNPTFAVVFINRFQRGERGHEARRRDGIVEDWGRI